MDLLNIRQEQENNVQLTTVANMLQWAQNWARSKSVWPLGYGLACFIGLKNGKKVNYPTGREDKLFSPITID